jgi:WD40 repeat protein
MHAENDSQIVASTQKGRLLVFDKETANCREIPAHDFEAWYVSVESQSMVYTASDDCSFKLWDLRVDTPVYKNTKHHTAGVTFCSPFIGFGEHALLTGSYDCSIALWDRRKLTSQPLESLSFDGKSVWDVKQTGGQLGICCVYDGYLFSPSAKSLSELQFKSY